MVPDGRPRYTAGGPLLVGRTRREIFGDKLVPHRQEVLRTLVGLLPRSSADRVVRVAIDGVDGAGKTHLADELADLLGAAGKATIRASIDGFHNPKAIRYQRDRDSPEGFFYDSYDHDQLKAVLLDPLSPGGSGRYRVATFDHRSDSPIHLRERVASNGDILLFDGIFLHRPELRGYWDYSIFLQVAFSVSIPRGAQRGEGSSDPASSENQRYIQGQDLYIRSCEPMSFATIIINNDDFASPYFVDARPAAPLA